MLADGFGLDDDAHQCRSSLTLSTNMVSANTEIGLYSLYLAVSLPSRMLNNSIIRANRFNYTLASTVFVLDNVTHKASLGENGGTILPPKHHQSVYS